MPETKEKELTPEEIKDIMSTPPDGLENMTATKPEDDDDFKNAERIDSTGNKEAKDALPPKENVTQEPPKQEVEAKKVEIDSLSKVEEDLAKPDGTFVDFKARNYTKDEIALYWQMKRDRRARQKAEEERDALRLEKAQKKISDEQKAPVEEELFKGRDKDDYITVEEAQKIIDRVKKAQEPTPPPPNPAMALALRMADREAAGMFEDYAEVVECAPEIVEKNPSYQDKIRAALYAGENPAIVMYELIKGDPDFEKTLPIAQGRLKAAGKLKTPPPAEKPAAQTPPPEDKEALKKLEEAKKAQEALELNQNKPKTSGNLGGGEDKVSGEITANDLLRMSDREFAKIPKAKRDAILKKYGV